MNEDAILTILRIVSWLGKAAMFVFVAAFFGGLFWIIGDIIGGIAVGIVMGIALGLLSGAAAVALLNALIRWIFPGLEEMDEEHRRQR